MGLLGDLLGGLPPVFVFVVVAALVVAEAAFVTGMVLPSATALVALGLLANAGVVPVVPALAVAVGAALLGGNLAYRSAFRTAGRAPSSLLPAGRAPSCLPTGGRAPSCLLMGGRASLWRSASRHGERAQRLFERHDGRAIFLGQWVVGARTLMPRLAGRNGVPHKRFALWHSPSATLWALWMVGASYLAGAGYNILAARAGRAAGALAALTLIILGLILAGRWLGHHPFPVRTRTPPRIRWHPAVAVAFSLTLLTLLAALLVEVIPAVVRFSGLGDVDDAVAAWARSQWTSDGYRFAVDTVTVLVPEALIALAVPIALLRRWRRGSGFWEALGPVLPVVVLAAVMSIIAAPNWQAVGDLTFPAPAEFAGPVPLDIPAAALAGLSGAATAQVAAATGLLARLLSHRLPWKWRVTVWTTAAVLVTTCAGSWIYLGWSRTGETVAAVILGAAWAALNAAIWSARSRPLLPPPPDPARELVGTAA